MSDNELLLALSDMMDKKLSAQLEPMKKDITGVKNDIAGVKKDIAGVKNDIAGMKNDISGMKNDITDLKNEVQNINVILENEIRQDIKLLAENYLPAALRYEKSNNEHDAMKSDIELIKKVVTEHSEKLQKIS